MLLWNLKVTLTRIVLKLFNSISVIKYIYQREFSMMNTSELFELCHTESVFTLLKSSIPKTYNKHRTIGIKALVTENPFDENINNENENAINLCILFPLWSVDWWHTQILFKTRILFSECFSTVRFIFYTLRICH